MCIWVKTYIDKKSIMVSRWSYAFSRKNYWRRLKEVLRKSPRKHLEGVAKTS